MQGCKDARMVGVLLLSSFRDLDAPFLHFGTLFFAPGITILGDPGIPRDTKDDT